MPLDREEYIEQAWFFRVLGERMGEGIATQDLLDSVRQEILSTTKLPMAIDFLAAELRLTGQFASAMARLKHYFTPFQAYVIGEAENEKSKFDFLVALEVLEREAKYRSETPTPAGAFLYQFETLCRNRLGYDKGLSAVAGDPLFDADWRKFVLDMRRQIGMVELADLIYVRSALYARTQAKEEYGSAGEGEYGGEGEDDHASTERSESASSTPPPPHSPSPPLSTSVLFGEKEGKIALANRRRDPLLLFAALQRHLNYPAVPRAKKVDESVHVLPGLLRRVERLESRLKLIEDEQRGGIDITRFYKGPDTTPAVDLEGEV